MAYQILNADGTFLLTLNDDTLDNTSTSLSLFGKDYSPYGLLVAQNFIQLLENSASPNPPTSPQVGQLWFNKTSTVLNVYLTAGTAPTFQAVATQQWVQNSISSSGTLFATASYVNSSITAALVNTALSGVPTAPTASNGNSGSQIANTAFVAASITSAVGNINVPHQLTVTGDATGAAQIGTSNATLSLSFVASGVTPGTYNQVVVDTKGIVTAATFIPTSTATATTQAQFDYSTNIATTAFVQRALGNYQSATIVNDNVPSSLSGSLVGGFVSLQVQSLTTYTTTIVDATIEAGASFTIWNNTGYQQTLHTTSTSLFYGPLGTGTNTFILFPNEVCHLISNGTNWIVQQNKLRTSAGPSAWNFSSTYSSGANYFWGTNDGLTMNAINPTNLSVGTAAVASSVAWANVSGKPTELSTFANDITKYLAQGTFTSSGIAVGLPTGNCVPIGGSSTGTFAISNCTTYLSLGTLGTFSMNYDVVNCASS